MVKPNVVKKEDQYKYPFMKDYNPVKKAEEDRLLPPEDSAPSSGGGGGYGGGGGGGGSAPPPESTKAEARAVLFAGLTNILGRKPTGAEVNAYLKALNAFEGENTKGISGDMKGQFTSDWVNEDPDLKAERRGYEVATKYFSAFAKAIQSPVSI